MQVEALPGTALQEHIVLGSRQSSFIHSSGKYLLLACQALRTALVARDAGMDRSHGGP